MHVRGMEYAKVVAMPQNNFKRNPTHKKVTW